MTLEILLLIIFTYGFIVNYKKNQQILMLANDDSDIKIAPNHFGHLQSSNECGTEEAEMFLKHKQKGNIDKAHNLGKKIFEVVKEQNDTHNFENKRITDVQLKALCAFLGIAKLYEYCPDTIVANSAKSVLYKEIITNLPEVYSIMNNNATYSLFLLNTYDELNKDISFGKAFAQIRFKPNNKEYVDFGANFYRKYDLILNDVFSSIIFEDI